MTGNNTQAEKAAPQTTRREAAHRCMVLKHSQDFKRFTVSCRKRWRENPSFPDFSLCVIAATQTIRWISRADIGGIGGRRAAKTGTNSRRPGGRAGQMPAGGRLGGPRGQVNGRRRWGDRPPYVPYVALRVVSCVVLCGPLDRLGDRLCSRRPRAPVAAVVAGVAGWKSARARSPAGRRPRP